MLHWSVSIFFPCQKEVRGPGHYWISKHAPLPPFNEPLAFGLNCSTTQCITQYYVQNLQSAIIVRESMPLLTCCWLESQLQCCCVLPPLNWFYPIKCLQRSFLDPNSKATTCIIDEHFLIVYACHLISHRLLNALIREQPTHPRKQNKSLITSPHTPHGED